MKRRVIRIVLTGAVVVGAAVLLWPRGEREPVYQGKKLSKWIAGARRMSIVASPGIRAREEAVRAIGTNALPFLVDWIKRGYRPGPNKIEPVVWKVNHRAYYAYRDFLWRDYTRSTDAMWAIQVLGKNARPAVPALLQLTRSTNSVVSGSAWFALGDIAPEVLPKVHADEKQN